MPTAPAKNSQKPRKATEGKGAVQGLVKKVVGEMSGKFTLPDVMGRLASGDKNVKKHSVKAVLDRLVTAGEIKVVSKGVGRRPSVFSKEA